MKKQILLFVFAFMISSIAFSQMSIGVKGGLNLANLSGSDSDDSEMRPSIHLGAYLNYAFSEKLSLQPELLYSSVGAKYEESNYDLTATYKMDYISIPVNLMYSFGKFNIHAGPQFGFLTSAKLKVEVGGDSDEQDLKDQLKGTDIGIGVGAGANFGKLNATIRYITSLSNVSDNDDVDIKNSVIQLSLGFRIFGGE